MYRIEQRFFTGPVACKKKLFPAAVIKSKREHPIKPLDAIFAPLFVGVNDDLGVRASLEPVPCVLQVLSQLYEVVYFAIKDDLKAAVFVAEGLGAAFHIDDAKTPVAKAYLAIDQTALPVRPAVPDDVSHFTQEAGVDRVTGPIEYAADATH